MTNEQQPSGDERNPWSRPDSWEAPTQPTYSEQPATGSPSHEAHPYGQPTYGQPTYGQPTYGQQVMPPQSTTQPHPSQGEQLPSGWTNWGPPAAGSAASQQAPVPQPRARVVRRREQPVVTMSIAAICVLVWLGEMLVAGVYEAVAMTPVQARTQPWRILTSAFAHSPTAITHILFNMWALWAVGQAIEGALGRARFAALYLLAAIGGGTAFILLAPAGGDLWFTRVVGASGAVFGLFGALLVLQRLVGQSTQQLWFILAINAAIPLLIPGIAWQAHAGGFVVGILVAWLDARAVRQANAGGPDRTWLWNGLVLLAMLVLLVGKYALAG